MTGFTVAEEYLCMCIFQLGPTSSELSRFRASLVFARFGHVGGSVAKPRALSRAGDISRAVILLSWSQPRHDQTGQPDGMRAEVIEPREVEEGMDWGGI